MFPELLRRAVFWGYDFSKGSLIAGHISDLKRVFANPQDSQQLAKQRLDNILNHACETTRFYKQFKGASLKDFPVIQKQTVKENYEDFFSSKYDRKNLVSTTTSGSYGTPFKFYQTKDKRARHTAEVIFFNGWAGYRVGMRYAQVRVYPRSKWLLFMQNGALMNPSTIDERWLEQQRQSLKSQKIRFIIGYPSAVGPLAEYCRMKGDRPDDFLIEGIITGAESLTSVAKEKLEEVFGGMVLDRYSSNEFGVMSHECAKCKTHHINIGSHKLELLAIDRDEPAEAGAVGRIVVTDYFSHAMPLIRYDTGDLARLGPECKCGLSIPTLKNIEGRTIEVLYDPDGRMVNAIVFDRETKDLEGILRFQMIQKSRDGYVCRLHVMPSFQQGDLIRERFQQALGPDAKITYEYVDSIPPLPSGKRPYVINEYKKL